jgi:hypothetical protein
MISHTPSLPLMVHAGRPLIERNTTGKGWAYMASKTNLRSFMSSFSPMPMALTAARWLLITLAVAEIADILTTNAALAGTPGSFEANPFMRLMMDRFGSWWWLWKALLAALFFNRALHMNVVSRRTIVVLGIVVPIYAVTIVSNVMGWL